MTKKTNPFGAAKPREEVLASKGIDAKLVDLRIQKKSAVARYTKAQEIELEAIRSELTSAERSWRDANEKELPEEEFRVLTETKRKELNELMKKFAEENSKNENIHNLHTKMERPSERRKRLDQGQQNRYNNDKSRSGHSGYNQSHWKGQGESSDNYGRGPNTHSNHNYHYRNKNYRNNANDTNKDDAYASFGRNKNYTGRRGDYDRQNRQY